MNLDKSLLKNPFFIVGIVVAVALAVILLNILVEWFRENWLTVVLMAFTGVIIFYSIFPPNKPRFETPGEEVAFREERARELAREDVRRNRKW